MILLTVDEIVMLHDKLLKATGGLPGLRDRGLLESAVFGANSSDRNMRKYPLSLGPSVFTYLQYNDFTDARTAMQEDTKMCNKKRRKDHTGLPAAFRSSYTESANSFYVTKSGHGSN